MMKPVNFLRNTWRKKDRQASTDALSRNATPSPSPMNKLADSSKQPSGFFDEGGRVAELSFKFSSKPSRSNAPGKPGHCSISVGGYTDELRTSGISPSATFHTQRDSPKPSHSSPGVRRAERQDQSSRSPPRRPPRPPTPNLFQPPVYADDPSTLPYSLASGHAKDGGNLSHTSFSQRGTGQPGFEKGSSLVNSSYDQGRFHSSPATSKGDPTRGTGGSCGNDHWYTGSIAPTMGRRSHDALRLPLPTSPPYSASDHSAPSNRVQPQDHSRSTPHLLLSALPGDEEGSLNPDFPLSLFPAPPPLKIRRNVPRPLILRSPASVSSLSLSPSSTSFSSRDSTPLATPTSPRIIASPSMGNTTNSMLKGATTRAYAHVAPPNHLPPGNSFSFLPTSPHGKTCPANVSATTRPLRMAQSAANLRRDVRSTASHRTTSSDSSSARSCEKSRGSEVEELNYSQPMTYSKLREEQVFFDSSDPLETHVQWGYAI